VRSTRVSGWVAVAGTLVEESRAGVGVAAKVRPVGALGWSLSAALGAEGRIQMLGSNAGTGVDGELPPQPSATTGDPLNKVDITGGQWRLLAFRTIKREDCRRNDLGAKS
jgi:hypothetical protein